MQSIDKIRIRAPISKAWMNQFMTANQNNPCIRLGAVNVMDIRKFKHVINFELSGGTGTVLYQHNSETITSSELTQHTAIIEFNPNKVDVTESRAFVTILHKIVTNPESIVTHFDIAVDISKPIDLFFIDNQKKQRVMQLSEKTRTIYCGKGRSDGYMKIYDKAEESGQQGPLTRVEHTVNKDIPVKSIAGMKGLDQSSYPVAMSYEQGLFDDIETRAMIELLQKEPDRLKSMTKYSRRKFREKLERAENVDKHIFDGRVALEQLDSILSQITAIEGKQRYCNR